METWYDLDPLQPATHQATQQNGLGVQRIKSATFMISVAIGCDFYTQQR